MKGTVGTPFYVVATFASLWGNACAQSPTVSVSLNVFPTTAASPHAGGAWTLIAKTNSGPSGFGIAAIDTYIAGINPAGITYGVGINAALDGGHPFVIPGMPVNLLYFQDTSAPGIVLGVGQGEGTPGNVAIDGLGDLSWNNSALVAAGTYEGNVPFFSSKGSNSTGANVLSVSSPPFNTSIEAIVTLVVRVSLSGDYNDDGVIDAADYVVWRDKLDQFFTLPNDTTAGTVTQVDYDVWRANFGKSSGGGFTASATVPEPTSLLLLVIGLVALLRQMKCDNLSLVCDNSESLGERALTRSSCYSPTNDSSRCAQPGHNGDADDNWETMLRSLSNDVYSAINEAGDI